jgi:hypothetical protein
MTFSFNGSIQGFFKMAVQLDLLTFIKDTIA